MKDTEMILQRLQDLEFLMLFLKLDLRMVDSKLNAVLLNQGGSQEALHKESTENFGKMYQDVFQEWNEIKDTISKQIEKAKAEGKL